MDVTFTGKQSQQNEPLPLQQWLQVVILAGLGAYFLYNIISGNLANYINERFVWLSWLAVVLFFVLALSAAYRIISGNSEEAAYGFSSMNMQTATWSVIATAAIPLILGVMIPSQPLGAGAIQGSISTSAVRGANVDAFSVAPENRNILDWLREFNSSSNHEAFNGQSANVVGFVYREPDFGPNEFMVARFTVSCCVADASALGLPVVLDNAEDFETGVWVQVQGEINVDDFNGDVLPIIYSDAIEIVEMPEHPYLYP